MPSALVIGSMVPDAWYFVPGLARDDSHDVLGVLWFCLPAGLIAYSAFHLIFKQPLLALLPSNLADRLAAWSTRGLPALPWLSVVASVLAGIGTHLVWDAFTHPGALPILEASAFAGVRVHQLLQHGSTLLGSAFLAWWVWRKVLSTTPRPAVIAHLRLRIAVIAAMILIPAFTFFSVLLAFDAAAWRTALRAAGVTALCTFGLVALLFSVAWQRWLSQETLRSARTR